MRVYNISKHGVEEESQSVTKVLSTGVITSPNFPGDYPNNLDKKETITVEFGKILRLEFTHFAVYSHPSSCYSDYIKVTDGDGTTLMDKSCGFDYSENENLQNAESSGGWYFQPPNITSNTNTVEIFFHTDDSGGREGWNLTWIAVTPGVKSLN